MKKGLIWLLIAVVILGGIFYIVSNKSKDGNLNEEQGIVEEGEKPSDIVEPPDSNSNEDTSDVDKTTQVDETTIEIGKVLPNFTLKNLKGEDVSLSDYKDKIVLVNFWATWCKLCNAEMPDLERLQKENDDIVVLAVNLSEEKSVVEKYIQKGGYTFEVVLDEEGKISQDYLVSGLPASYFTNKDGIFLGRVPGMLTYEQMNEIVDNIRKEQQ
ncbi:TlpA family protein disulfide reductase [Tissierellaceae bacterium HCP3S3_D8]